MNYYFFKKSYLVGIIVLELCLCSCFQQRTTPIEENKNVQTKYFSISVSNGWTLTSSNNDCSNDLTYKNEAAGSIEVYPKWKFGTSYTALVSNIYGVHATVGCQEELKNLQNYTIQKVTICFEKSAAEEYNQVDTSPDQIHYFYSKDNLVIDFALATDFKDTEEIEQIAKSLKY